jgi:hypothetical protein
MEQLVSELWGAFGALGGDLSSLNVNPAGSAILTIMKSLSLSNNDIKIIQIILEQQLLKKVIPT